MRGRGDDLLAHERAAESFDQVELGVDLVGAVHRDVERDRLVHERDAELARERGRRLRRGHGGHAQPFLHGLAEGVDERRGRLTGAEAHHVAGLDLREGGCAQRRRFLIRHRLPLGRPL